jgi:outer membrane protein assembly factor BamB|tara:strand:- start:1397 stop:2755 length:1359 start_codon:yes stop_codon:yes gene_type:complete
MVEARMPPVVALALVLLATSARAEDWPQWRGPTRSGVWNETGIVDRFPDDGLTVTWRVPIRAGFAGPVVADGRVFVLDYQETPGTRTMDGAERLVVLDEQTGEQLWTHEWPATYRNLHVKFASGPRATPSVVGDRVYVVGAAGMILCLDTATGAVVWQVDTVADYGISVPVYGISASPLVDGDRVITLVGGEPDALVVAFDTRTGDEVWRALPTVSETGYAAPMIYEAGGVRQLIVWQPRAMSALDPVTGEVYWEHEWIISNSLTVATPVSSGSYLLATHFHRGSLMLRLDQDRPAARELWRGQSRSELPGQTDGLHSLITTPLIIGDYVYGVGSYGELRCLDARTGERVWESDAAVVQERWGTAMFVQHGDRVFVVNESGELILARLTPEGYDEIDRIALIAATTRTRGGATGRWGDRGVVWAHPAYANRHIVLRNDDEIIRVSLAAADYQ